MLVSDGPALYSYSQLYSSFLGLEALFYTSFCSYCDFPMVLQTVGDGKYLLTAAEKMNWMSFYYLGIAEKSTWCIKSLTSSFICLTSVHSHRISLPATVQTSGVWYPHFHSFKIPTQTPMVKSWEVNFCHPFSIHSVALMTVMLPCV